MIANMIWLTMNNNKEYKFRTNYSNFPFANNESINQSVVLNNFPDEVKLKDLDTYFKRSKFNSAFYDSIKSELIKCLIAEKENNHLWTMTSTMATYFEYCHTLENWLVKRKVSSAKAKDLVASLMFGLSHSMLLSKTKTKNLQVKLIFF
jgi:hypothetical protein